MTVRETKDILKFLQGCYPAFYRNASPQEAENILIAWSTLFSDEYYTYKRVFNLAIRSSSRALRIRAFSLFLPPFRFRES